MMPYRCFEDDESYILYLGLVKYPRPITPTSVSYMSSRRIRAGIAREILEEFAEKGYVERILEGRGGSKKFLVSPSIPPDAVRMNDVEANRYIKQVFNMSDIGKLYHWKFVYMVQSAVISKILMSTEDIDVLKYYESLRNRMELSLDDIVKMVGNVPTLFGFGVNVNDVLDEIERFVSIRDDAYVRVEFSVDWREKGFRIIKMLGGASILKFDGSNVSLLFVLEPAFTLKIYFKNY